MRNHLFAITLSPQARPAGARRSVRRWAHSLHLSLNLSLGVLVALWAASAQAQPQNQPPARPLQTVVVQTGHSAGRYVADATLEAVRESKVASQVPGRIVELLVKAGDRVQAGQVLLRVDPAVVSQQVAGAQAQLAQAQALRVSAQAAHERTRQLFRQKYVSQAALDQAEAQFKAADAQVRAAQAQVAAVSTQAAQHTVRAPFAGWVSELLVSLGDQAAPGVPLLVVYDPSALRISAQLPESATRQIDTNLPPQFEVAGRVFAQSDLPGGGALRAQVLPAFDSGSRTATVRVDLPKGVDNTVEGLRPGQSVKLTLALKPQAAQALGGAAAGLPLQLSLPRQALVQRGEVWGVYVVGVDGKPRLRQVRPGRQGAEQVEVLAGLNPGEKVALDPVAAARALQP